MEEKCKHQGFIGVHIGAGQHSEARTAMYLNICAAACNTGVQVLREGGSALDAAEKATKILEDAGETNAGYGSNLTESGTIEMDAGLMDGSSLLFGAVGAITDVKNPISVARQLVEEQKKGLLPLGRVPPGFLVGQGAKEWAIRHGIPTVTEQSLVSEKAHKLYKHYKKKLDMYNSLSAANTIKRKRDDSALTCKRLRTAQKLAISEHVRSNDGATSAYSSHSSRDICIDGVYSITGFEKVESESLPLATSQQPALHPAPTAAVAVLPQQHQQQQQQPPVSQCQHNITQLSIQPHSSLQADGVQGDGLHDLDLVHSNSHSHTAEAIHSQTVGFDDGGSPALSKFTDNNTGATTQTLSVSNIPDSNEDPVLATTISIEANKKRRHYTCKP